MNDETPASIASIGTVFIELDGSYSLRTFDELKPGDKTLWGIYDGVTRRGDTNYHVFLQKVWDEFAEIYEEKYSYIAHSALVHPRTKIHHDVTIESRAVVASGVELLTGATVAAGKTISSDQTYHHLTTDEGSPIMNSTAA